jgi:hypothetical protein
MDVVRTCRCRQGRRSMPHPGQIPGPQPLGRPGDGESSCAPLNDAQKEVAGARWRRESQGRVRGESDVLLLTRVPVDCNGAAAACVGDLAIERDRFWVLEREVRPIDGAEPGRLRGRAARRAGRTRGARGAGKSCGTSGARRTRTPCGTRTSCWTSCASRTRRARRASKSCGAGRATSTRDSRRSCGTRTPCGTRTSRWTRYASRTGCASRTGRTSRSCGASRASAARGTRTTRRASTACSSG